MIKSLRLQNYRSYEDGQFTFSEGVNIIVGANGSGKTNLLEGILVVCTNSSFRAKDNELVQHGKQWARIDANTDDEHRTIKIQKEAETTKKTLTINDQEVHRVTSKKRLPVVLFEPNDLLLFGNGPDRRREFMDDLIEAVHPEYASVRRGYKRCLAQRNRLLKTQPPNVRNQLFVWNIKLSELGSQVVEFRRSILSSINAELPGLYGAISASESQARVSYVSNIGAKQYSSTLLHKLEQHTELDLVRGFTSYGPHRDDMCAMIDDHDIRESASRGEVRSVVLALKIIELQLVESRYETNAILLLDDVFSELDGTRRESLTQLIKEHQTFITTTDADVAHKQFHDSCTIISMKE